MIKKALAIVLCLYLFESCSLSEDNLKDLSEIQIMHEKLDSYNGGVHAITVIFQQSCPSCIEDEISNLNRISYLINENKISVYVILSDSASFDQTDIKFSWNKIDNPEEIFSDKIVPRNPF